MMKDLLMIGFGGFAGSICRYLISSVMIGACSCAIPLGTFTVNAAGSFLIGLMLSTFGSGTWYYLCVVGFCGGFTTFSTFSAELFQMARSGHYGYAATYVGLSVAVCLIAVGVGLYIGEKINFKI